MSALPAKFSPAIAIGILVILYTVGIFGILLPLHPDFIDLTPVNLLVTFGLVLYFHPDWKPSTIFLFAFCFIVGFGVELVGVQTGLVFGNYQYGGTLGPKLWGTPLMIGVNWVMLVYCSGVAINAFWREGSPLLRAAAAAAVMTALDFLIEPVAMRYDFWSWADDQVPLQNYLAWFVIAFVLLRVFYQIEGVLSNKVGVALLLLQFVFFAILFLS